MQRLQTEHQVDARRAIDDRAAPSCDATQPPTPGQHVGALLAERAHAAEIVEHALLRLLAHRAGIEQDDVGVVGAIGRRETFAGEYVGHAVRVVLVHLAAERANEKLACHWRRFEKGQKYSKAM